MACVNFRKQQIVYGVAVLLAVIACVSCGLVSRFNDIDFTGDLRSQYRQLTNSATPLLEMNVAFAIFTGVLCLVDLFRSKTTPVWFEMIWTFIFGTLEIICIVIVAQNYPSAHCKPSSASPSLGRRDAADDSVIGQAASATSAQNLSKASKELCANWAAMVVLFTMIAVMLFAQWGWLALLTLRHRRTSPNFIWFSETPAPFTWRLTASEGGVSSDDASFVSSSASTMDEKKSAGLMVPVPQPIQVRVERSNPQQRVDFYGLQV